MSNLQKWIDPNGLIVLGATLALLGVVALAAAVSLPWHDARWLIAPGLGLSGLGAALGGRSPAQRIRTGPVQLDGGGATEIREPGRRRAADTHPGQ